MDAVVAVTEMHVLLFVLHVCILRYCEGDGNTGVGNGGCLVAVSAGCECMGDTRGSGVVSNAESVLDMSAVRGLRGVDGLCEMCLLGAGRGVWEVSG